MSVSAASASNRWTEQGLQSSETVAETLIFAIAASSLYLLAKPETQQDDFRSQPPGIKSLLCYHPPPVASTECQKYIKCSISSTEDSQEFRFSGSFIAVLISRTVFETTCSRPPLTRLCPPVPSHAVGFPPLRPQVDKRAASILSSVAGPSSPQALIYVLRPRSNQGAEACADIVTYCRSYRRRFWQTPAVPVQLFANDLHSCMSRRKCVE